jgi:hypothetical protein
MVFIFMVRMNPSALHNLVRFLELELVTGIGD